jgi:hypothetical protein
VPSKKTRFHTRKEAFYPVDAVSHLCPAFLRSRLHSGELAFVGFVLRGGGFGNTFSSAPR